MVYWSSELLMLYMCQFSFKKHFSWFMTPLTPNSTPTVLDKVNFTNFKLPLSTWEPQILLKYFNLLKYFKGCGMGPWLVLFSPCFGENVVATCKIGSFLCRLDNLLQKNVIVFFFGNQISTWRSFEKRAIFDLFFTFFSHQGKLQKILQHISHSHTYTYFAHPIDFFCLTNFE